MNTIFKVTFAVAMLALANCASVTRGTSDTLQVRSNKPGVTINVTRVDRLYSRSELKNNQNLVVESNGVKILKSEAPAAFKLKRKGTYRVTAHKRGYKSAVAQVNNKVSGWGATGVAGNVLVGGVIGLGVDTVTGAAKNLVPNPLYLPVER